MSYSNREAKGGSTSKNHAKKDSKSKRGYDVSELINFHYERPTQQQPVSQRSNRKYIPRSSAQHLSKAQFVQAHFRFLLSPLTNPLEPCLYEPDTIVPWQFISCVVLPKPLHLAPSNSGLAANPSHGVTPAEAPWAVEGSPSMSAAGYDTNDMEHSILTCPICLDDVQIPRITSCGHTFCYTCILRHLYSDLSNVNKCPICAVAMCASDLKTVLHYDDNLQRIFCAPASGNVSASAGNSATEVLKVGQDAEFSLLQIQKGTMVPRLCVSPEPSNIAHSNTGGGGNSSNGNKITLGQVLPVCTAECAPYNRLTHLTLDMVHQLFMYEKEQLLAYRRRCLPVDVTPSIVVAKNNKSASTCDNSPSQSVWGAKRSTSTTADADTTNTTTTNTAAAAAATVGQSGSTAAGGDVEALPYIQLALERQQQAEVEFQAKLAQRALVTNLMGDHNVGAVSGGTGGGSNGSNSAVGGDVGSSNAAGDNPGVTGGTPASATVVAKQPTDKSIYHLYQHSSGALIFLHPICTKCLLEAHTIDTTAVLPSLNAGRSPAGSPRLKNKKNANAGPPDPADSLAESTAQLSVNNNDSSPHSARTDPTTTVITPEAQVLPTIIHAYKPTVRGKIIDIEVVRVNADIRQRYNALRHLPIHSEVLLLEIDLHSMVPAHVLCKYAEELNKRATKRKERARQEKREKRLDQDRSMAEALLAQERHDYIMAQRAEADYHLQQLMQGPSLDVYSAGSGGGSSGGGAGSTAGSGSDCQNIVASEDGVGVGDKDSSESQQQIEASSNINSSTKSISSFATITQMGGNFPALGQAATGPSASNSKSANSKIGTSSVWGTPVKPIAATPFITSTSTSTSGANTGSTSTGGSRWGNSGDKPTRGVSSNSVLKPTSESGVEASSPLPLQQQGSNEGGVYSGKKGQKKTKIVLMTSLRAAR